MKLYQMSAYCFGAFGILSLLLGTSAVWGDTSQATDKFANPPHQLVAEPSSQGYPTAAVGTEERAELLEYRLAERIETRVMSSLKGLAAILGIVLAVAAFFGAAIVLDYLSGRVEKQVRSRLQEEFGGYRKRLQDNLAELELSVLTQRALADRMKSEFATLQETSRDLGELKAQYSRLHAE